MLTTIRRMGNSQGVLIPKPLLQQLGLVDQADMRVEGDALVLRRPTAGAARWLGMRPAASWPASATMALVLPEFGNEDDAELSW